MKDFEDEGDWKWFNSEKPDFTNWAQGEQNNYQSNEDFASVVLSYDDGRTIGQWIDNAPSNVNQNIDSVIFEWDFELKWLYISFKNYKTSKDPVQNCHSLQGNLKSQWQKN